MGYCLNDKPRAKCNNLNLLFDQEARKLALTAHSLSDPIRIQMVYLLGQTDDICTCEFEALLGLSQSKVSYHLKQLMKAGIVNRQLFGTWSHYSLADRTVLERVKALVVLKH